MITLVIKQGDITKENVDVIVNAANETLLGGGGVDGAIHRAAGPELLKECLKFPVKISNGQVRCLTGDAEITKGYNLPSQFIIHTVGPRCFKGIVSEENKKQLYNCWSNCLKIANAYNLKTIAFPSISTGIFAFPITQASEIAIKAIKNFDNDFSKTTIEEIVIVCFNMEDYEVYKNTLSSFDTLYSLHGKEA